MSRTRQWTAVGIVGVLALALGLLWRSQNTAAPTTSTSSTSTIAFAAVTTTTSVASTTLSPTTTSSEQRLAEVELILSEIWYGWFDAIYRKDPDALWDFVATTQFHESGLRAMESLSFDGLPDRAALAVRVDRILLDRTDCLVAYSSASAPFLTTDPTEVSVNVMWPDPDGEWRFASTWVYPDDLWLADCDEVVREVTP